MHLILPLLLIVSYLFFQIYNKGIHAQITKKEIYSITILLILLIGFRGEGIDNDYSTYVRSINQFLAIGEPTFLLIATFIKIGGLPVSILFVIYACIGISFKMKAIFKMSPLPYISIIIYLSNIALLQDINQIRAGAATAIFLISLPCLIHNKKKKYILLITIASLFHFSALLYFTLLFINKKELQEKTFFYWAIIPLLGYIFFYLFNQTLIENIPISSIREKLLMYRRLQESGAEGFANINLFNPYFLFKLFIYYFILQYYTKLKSIDDNITIYLKIFGLSLFIFPALGAITPILGYRSSDLFACIEIFLFPYFFLLFKGEKIKVVCIACYFVLLFSINIFYKHLIYL